MKNHAPKIERGIEMPHGVKGGRLSPEAALMRQMKVGDSLLLHKKHSAAIQLTVRHLGVGNYVMRQEGDAYRVWKSK